MTWSTLTAESFMVEEGKLTNQEIIAACSASKTLKNFCDKNDYDFFRKILRTRYNIVIEDLLYIAPNLTPRQLFALMPTTYFDRIACKRNTRVDEKFDHVGFAIPDVVFESFAQEKFNMSADELLKFYSTDIILKELCRFYAPKTDQENLVRMYGHRTRRGPIYKSDLPRSVDGVQCLIKSRVSENEVRYLIYGIIIDAEDMSIWTDRVFYGFSAELSGLEFRYSIYEALSDNFSMPEKIISGESYWAILRIEDREIAIIPEKKQLGFSNNLSKIIWTRLTMI